MLYEKNEIMNEIGSEISSVRTSGLTQEFSPYANYNGIGLESEKFRLWFAWEDGVTYAYLEPQSGFARCQSAVAVVRRLLRMSRGLRMVAEPHGFNGVAFRLYNRKDFRRLNELLKYANGRALAKTAANNRGKWT